MRVWVKKRLTVDLGLEVCVADSTCEEANRLVLVSENVFNINTVLQLDLHTLIVITKRAVKDSL
jgi:hypothetical protein